ncbi:MAG TPA: hypothetical protein VD969_07685 [Symbiobacteriaceae bacterium]|nr:hypothetical protein [Symbiobacteriaceae bacterium]
MLTNGVTHPKVHYRPEAAISAMMTVAMIPETVGLCTGKNVYGNWWNYGWSVGAHVVLWSSFYGLYRWLDPA